MAVDAQFVLLQRQRLAGGHAQLPLHQVQPGDGFGHRVLHLQAGVHFHEVEAHLLGVVVAARLLDDELHRAGAHVVHRLGGCHRGQAHLLAQLGRQAGRGRLFQHFLVAALHRAVALEQVDAVAVRVAEHLDLDVARALHVFLDQHRVAAEAVARFALAAGQCVRKVLGLFHRAHALAAAAGAGLDEHRVADAVGLVLEQGRVLVGAVVAGHQGHTGLLHQALGLGLQAHGLDGRGRRADEHQPGLGAGVGKGLVLAQEAVARVNGLGPGGLGRGDDALPLQVALARGAATDVHRFVAGGHVLGTGVGVGIHGHGAHTEAAGRGGNAAGDFAAVGDQDLFKHGQLLRRTRLHTLCVSCNLMKRPQCGRFRRGWRSGSCGTWQGPMQALRRRKKAHAGVGTPRAGT